VNTKKTILYLLVTILTIVFAYNYLLLPFIFRYNGSMGMGMGMHMGMGRNMYNNYNVYNGLMNFIFIIVAITILIFFYKVSSSQSLNRCSKCGNKIESDRWKVCPICGNRLVDGKDDSK